MSKIKDQLYSVAMYFSDIAQNLNDLKNVDPEAYEDGKLTLSEMQRLAGILDVSVICTTNQSGLYDSVVAIKGKSDVTIVLSTSI